MTTFAKLKQRTKNELGLILFRDTVQLSTGTMKYHMRENNQTLAWPHFRSLNEVREYLDNTKGMQS
jgi:hypothetical protein